MELNGEAFSAALVAYDACGANNPPTNAGKILALRAAIKAYQESVESVRVAPAPASQQEASERVLTMEQVAEIMASCNVAYFPGMAAFIRTVESEVVRRCRAQRTDKGSEK